MMTRTPGKLRSEGHRRREPHGDGLSVQQRGLEAPLPRSFQRGLIEHRQQAAKDTRLGHRAIPSDRNLKTANLALHAALSGALADFSEHARITTAGFVQTPQC